MDSSVKKKMRRPMVNDSGLSSKTSARVKAPIRRRDTGFEQLESLHKSSETSSRLRIPDGKRIKLSHDYTGDGIHPATRTTKKVSKSDVAFSVLGEHDGVASESCPIELSDSDEFPDFHELVRDSVRSAGEADESLVSRASDYSDSDMDALIRSVHLDVGTSTGIDTAHKQDISASGPIQQTLDKGPKGEGRAVSINARTRASAYTGTISPRLRTQVLTHKIFIRSPRSLMIKEQSTVGTRSPLFHPWSDSEPYAPSPVTAAEDPSAQEVNFVLDETLFDIIGSEATKNPPVPPSPGLPSSPVKTQHLSALDSDEPSFYVAWKNEQRKKYGDDWKPVPVQPCPPAEPEHDHLADFQEWLANTDSIEFID